MKNILTNFYEQIRTKVLVSEIARSYVTLIKKGYEYSGLCPFHNEKTPSFTINDNKKFYHCFGCGAHGDVIKFESEQSGMSYKDSAYKIAEKYSIDIPIFSLQAQKEVRDIDRIMSLMTEACNYYASCMNDKIRQMLNTRGIKNHTIDKYKIGYAGASGGLISFFAKKSTRLEELGMCGLVSKKSDGRYYEFFSHRIIIPIISNFGKIIGFGGRSIGSELPKYINSPENLIFKKGESLYGENIASSVGYKVGSIILVEGYFDVITLHQSGFKNTVASLGTAVTKMQLEKLWQIAPEIIVCLDGDAAGVRASKKILDIAIDMVSATKRLSFMQMSQKLDPEDMINKYGSTNFERILNNRLNLSEYIFKSITANKPSKTPEDRACIESDLASYVIKIKDVSLKQNMQKYFYNMRWNLYNKKSPTVDLRTNLAISASSEIENIDDLILSFIMTNISLIPGDIILLSLRAIESSSRRVNLIEFVTEYVDSLSNSSDLSRENLKFENDIKKTSFCDEFEILCRKYKRSIGPLNIQGGVQNMLEYLLSKRYLCILTEEFRNLMNLNTDSTEEKKQFYLNEIQSTKEKINNFDMGFLQQ